MFKYHAKLYMPKVVIPERSLLGVDVQYHTDWLFKNGNIKKQDCMNLDKLMADTLSESIGVDDSYFWEWHSRKVHNPATKKTVIRLYQVGLMSEENIPLIF